MHVHNGSMTSAGTPSGAGGASQGEDPRRGADVAEAARGVHGGGEAT